MSDDLSPEDYESNGRTREEEAARIKLRLLTAVSRGAAVGLILRGGLTLFVTVLSLLMRRKQKTERNPIKEILRMTFFLSSFAGVSVLTDEAISALFGNRRTASWRGLIAGLLAGPSILFLGKSIRHDSMAVYVFVRALTLFVRCGNRSHKYKILKFLLSPTRFSFGDVVLMSVSTSQILYSFIMMPHTLPSSYRHFLTRQTCRPNYVWETLREMALNGKCRNGIAEDGFQRLKGTGHIPCYSSVPCGLLHPNESCVENIFSVFLESYARALTVYFPVYVAPAILVHRKDFLLKGKVLLPKVLLGILRSSLFLSSVVSLAYAGCCSVHNVTNRTTPWTLAGSFLLPGIGLITEKTSRRMELSLYAFARALESFAHCFVDWKYFPETKWRSDVLLFSLATAFITHCYSDDEGKHRLAFRSKYLNVLDFVFGNTGIHSGAIHHIPSNQDLIEMGSNWFTNLGWFGNIFKWN